MTNQIDAIRARLETFENASKTYHDHRARYPGFGSVARKLEEHMLLAYDNAILKSAPADLRVLLAQHNADQQRIAALEAALRDHGPIVYPLYEIGDTAHSAFIVSGDPQVKQFMQKISRHTDVALSRIRAALKGDDND